MSRSWVVSCRRFGMAGGALALAAGLLAPVDASAAVVNGDVTVVRCLPPV